MREIDLVRQLLTEHGIRPNRALGQNFLTDEDTLERIAAFARVDGAAVLEIGPGLGSLTERLLARASRLETVEKDAVLAGILRERFPGEAPGITSGDILRTDPDRLLPRPYHVVGNLPYYITTDIAERMLCVLPESLTFLVQKEAAERFFAGPGDRVYGPLSVLTACLSRPEHGFDVPADRFFPQPDVESAVVRLAVDGASPAAEDPAGFLRFLKSCFRMRRKTLANNLKGTAGGTEALGAAGIDGSLRAEALPPDRLLALWLEARKLR